MEEPAVETSLKLGNENRHYVTEPFEILAA
jgi:hypothetical protein